MSQAGIARVILVPTRGDIDTSDTLANHPTIAGWINSGLATHAHIRPIQVYVSGTVTWVIEIMILTTSTQDALIVAGLSQLSTTLGVTLETWSYPITYG